MIPQLIEAGALFVINHSGGKDGQAMLIKLAQTIPVKQMIVVHASLGRVEWPRALEHAEENAQAAGVPFIVAKASKTLIDMVERRFATRPDVPSWPSAAHRQCTSDLKRGPIEREVRRYATENGFSIVVNCLGLRAEESPARAKRQVLKLNERNTTRDRTWYDYLPIQDLTEAEVFATIATAGQMPHYAYSLGNKRLSCVFCILSSQSDLANGAKHNPGLFIEYKALEQRTGYTMHQSRQSLASIVEKGGDR